MAKDDNKMTRNDMAHEHNELQLELETCKDEKRKAEIKARQQELHELMNPEEEETKK